MKKLRVNSSGSIFLSHAAVDAPIADFVRSTIVGIDRSRDVFVSSKPGQIPADSEWWDVIAQRLRSAEGYVVLLTPNSVARYWVYFEFGAAWMSNRQLIPARAGKLLANQLVPPLS